MPEKGQSKLADALERVNAVARKAVVRSASVQRGDRELLTQRGYLQEIFKGWYFLSRPGEKPGESTAWYTAFWDFLSVYLEERFGSDYCLNAGSSIDLHTGGNLIPRQVVALTGHGGTVTLELPHKTSLVAYLDAKNLPRETEIVRGVRVMPLAMALCRVQSSFFERQPLSAEIALRAIKSADDLVRNILESESPARAARFAGAYQFLRDTKRAEQIIKTVHAAGINFEPRNPFVAESPFLSGAIRVQSAYAGRIEGLFKTSRGAVLDLFRDWGRVPFKIRRLIWMGSKQFTSTMPTTRYRLKVIASRRS